MPLFIHDCDLCAYLGSDNKYDYYYHFQEPRSVFNTLVARYGSEGRDYTSSDRETALRLSEDNPVRLAYARYPWLPK